MMSPQETQALEAFLNQLVQARAASKDPQVAAIIASAVAHQPDADYLLVQRALLLEQALEVAKMRIAALENQLRATQGDGSGQFLDPANAWGNSVTSRPTAVAPAAHAGYMPQPPMQQIPAARPSFLGGGAGGMLGSIASTAAGVAAGEFLFQGIENLLHPHSSGQGFLAQPAIDPAAAAMDPAAGNPYYGLDDPSANVDDSAGSDNFLDDNSAPPDDYGSDNFGSDDSSVI